MAEATENGVGDKGISDEVEVQEKLSNLELAPGEDKQRKNRVEVEKKELDQVLTQEQLQKAILQAMQLQGDHTPKALEEAARKKYRFWETQPVQQFTDIDKYGGAKVGGARSGPAPRGVTTTDSNNEALEADKEISEIRPDTYKLPNGFEWCEVSLHSDDELAELYALLNENYVEDDDNMFRFDYSPPFLRWALQPPGWKKCWHVGVRVTKSRKLVGFIAAVPARIKINEKTQSMVEINFLCVHKILRSKRLAPVLIKEITRRVNLTGLFQAVYTAGVILPKPVSTARYYHRSLNPSKLVAVKFSHLGRNMTLQRAIKLYKLPAVTKLQLKPLEERHVASACQLLDEYLSGFRLAPRFSETEFRHWFLPRKDVVQSFVVETDGKVTDFSSFYSLPSTVVNHEQYNSLQAAYSFYNVAGKSNLVDLINDTLVLAKRDSFDVFNALNLMENARFLEPLKFGIGDGNLHYYLYNWRCGEMQPHEVGLVLQ